MANNEKILELFNQNTWLITAAVVLFFAVVLSWVESLINRRLKPRLAKTKYLWDEALVHAMHLPLQVFIWSTAVSLLVPSVINYLLEGVNLIDRTNAIRELLIILTFFWFFMRFISRLEVGLTVRSTKNKHIRDRTTIRAMSQLVRILLIIITVMIVMQTLGISITALIAFGGVGGLAISFAAKDTIANFLGGMMIFWDRPFSVGDWVRSPDRNIEGTVEHIGWRLTRIRTFDKRPLYVPNGIFSNVAIENPSRMTNRRIKVDIGLRYDDANKVAGVLTDVEAMLKQHPAIDQTQTLMVNLTDFGPSSLDFMIYTFTKTTNWVEYQAIRQEVLLKTIDIITASGAECAFPTRTLHIPEAITVAEKTL